jgi:hypothetical protein
MVLEKSAMNTVMIKMMVTRIIIITINRIGNNYAQNYFYRKHLEKATVSSRNKLAFHSFINYEHYILNKKYVLLLYMK